MSSERIKQPAVKLNLTPKFREKIKTNNLKACKYTLLSFLIFIGKYCSPNIKMQTVFDIYFCVDETAPIKKPSGCSVFYFGSIDIYKNTFAPT